MRNVIAVASLVLVLALVNWSIYKKENHLAHGAVVYLQLAPVDPRSLMQGDYMALRFAMANEIRGHLKGVDYLPETQGLAAVDEKALVTLDENRVATFKSIYQGGSYQSNEMLLAFRVREGQIKFATNAYFFQEGTGRAFESARYGEFRVNEKGELLLTALRDKDLNKIIATSENI